uniref:BI1-like protein n=1 Tax=Gossypium raimondii TaxID=29730 RepID=A0A0D2TFH7_GOSRA|nr:hypothetical protein B456_011G181100 [Gossypium raimondii]
MSRYERVSSTSASKADKVDLESGDTLYRGLSYGENQLRWGFIRKVYGILAAQLVLTTVVSAFVVFSAPVNELLRGNSGILLFLCLVPFILLWPLHVYHQKHPVNLIILGLFTVSLSLTVGVSCANTDGVVASLTGYTFWASKKGKDFSFLGPILFTSLIILILTGLIQMFFPLGSTSTAVYGGISALIFCGYIVYDTDNLIKRFTYDDYILASATLYLDILNLFISILRVLRSGDN